MKESNEQFFAEERARVVRNADRDRLKRLFTRKLFDTEPDKEMLARMWEIDPETMSELMPEVGTDAFEVPEVPKWRVFAGIALNNLRLCMDKWPKETRSPEKRIRDAWEDYQDIDNYEELDEEARSQAIFSLVWEDARRRVREEREQERRNLFRNGK